MDEALRSKRKVLAGLVSSDPQTREFAGDEVRDIAGSLSPEEGLVFVHVLVAAVLAEPPSNRLARNAFLTAILALVSEHGVAADQRILGLLKQIGDLDSEEREFVVAILA